MTLDESFDENEDYTFDVEGINVAISKSMYDNLTNLQIGFNEDSGIVIYYDSK